MNFVNVVLIVTCLSSLIQFFVFAKNRITTKLYIPFLVYILQSIAFTFSEIISIFKFNSSYPFYHFSMIIELMTLMWLLDRIIRYRRISISILIISISIFGYETIYRHKIFENNEIFNVAFNFIISFISVIYLLKLLNPNSKINNNKYLALFLSFIFIQSTSSLVLSVYETQIRSSISFVSDFMFIVYNVLEIAQSVSTAYVIWKLREA